VHAPKFFNKKGELLLPISDLEDVEFTRTREEARARQAFFRVHYDSRNHGAARFMLHVAYIVQHCS
jgi:hypothetical protein